MTGMRRAGRIVTAWAWVVAGLGVALLSATVLGEARIHDHEAVKAMPLAARTQECLACHAGEKERDKLANPAHACDAHCLRCHKDMEKHHPVGPEVEEKDKVSLPLLGTNKVACISCHDLKSAQTDTRSLKAQSLFGRLFQGQKIYKTYYLRINNSDGSLCKACH